MYRIMIILLVILFVSLSVSAQEMIMYGKVEQIEKGYIIVDGKKFPIQKGFLIPEVKIGKRIKTGEKVKIVERIKIGEKVKIVESPGGVVRVERIEREKQIEIFK